ncbi:lipocalin family protein [Psychroserpens mesophilus]|uniref:lipocalin family protein n=1 Tax=Psychroserpens mesophilus TaxID=325473 RepID=UPI003D65D859
MKKFKLPLGIVMGLLIFSCSSNDDNNNSSTEVSIIGTWRLIGVSSSDAGNAQLTDCGLMTRLTFMENSMASFKEHYDNNNDCLEDNYTVEYSVDNNSLSFISNAESNNFLYELTATSLSYSQTENGITNTTSWQRGE